MKTLFILFISTLFILSLATAQDQNEKEIFEIVKIQPEYPGGMSKFYGEYILKNLRYPSDARKANIEGKVRMVLPITFKLG